MLLKICTLWEIFCASWDSTNEGLFLSVNSQMVKKVASFLKLLSTVRILAFHYSSGPFCIWMLISYDLIKSSIWNVLWFAYPMEGSTFLNTIFFYNCFSYTDIRIASYTYKVVLRELVGERNLADIILEYVIVFFLPDSAIIVVNKLILLNLLLARIIWWSNVLQWQV